MRERCAAVWLTIVTVIGTATTPPPALAALPKAVFPPSALLLTAADLPAGSIEDDALANPGATALTSTYGPLIAASAFSGFRTPGSAIVQTALVLRSADDAPALIAAETAAVKRTPSAALLTLNRRYGDDTPLAYTIRGTRRDHWVMAVVGVGVDAVVLGVEGPGSLRQQTLTTLEHLATLVEAHLRTISAASSSRQHAAVVRVLTLATTLRDGRVSNVFHPRAVVYWHIAWRITTAAPGAREQAYDALACNGKTLHRNQLSDLGFAGENAADDRVTLPPGRTGQCVVSFYIRVGRASVRAVHPFRVVLQSTKPARKKRQSARKAVASV